MIAPLSYTLNDMTDTTHSTQATHKPRPLIDLLVSILIPSLILMKLSGESRLGADGALMLALAFPLGWGAEGVWWGLAGGLACAAIGLTLGFEWKTARLLQPAAAAFTPQPKRLVS